MSLVARSVVLTPGDEVLLTLCPCLVMDRRGAYMLETTTLAGTFVRLEAGDGDLPVWLVIESTTGHEARFPPDDVMAMRQL